MTPISLNKSSYKLPELIHLFSERFNIEIYDQNGHVNNKYYNIKSALYLRLEGLGKKTSDSSRDVVYSREDIQKICDDRLISLFEKYSK